MPLRDELSGDGAAFGAVCALVAETGILERAAISAAIEILGGKGRTALEQRAAAAFALLDGSSVAAVRARSPWS